MYLIHVPFSFVKDKLTDAPLVLEDGSYALDLTSDPIAVWKVCKIKDQINRKNPYIYIYTRTHTKKKCER